MPVLREGERLQQGATYLDLLHPDEGEIRPSGDMVAETGSAYVPRDQVAYPTWNRLRGVDDPQRL